MWTPGPALVFTEFPGFGLIKGGYTIRTFFHYVETLKTPALQQNPSRFNLMTYPYPAPPSLSKTLLRSLSSLSVRKTLDLKRRIQLLSQNMPMYRLSFSFHRGSSISFGFQVSSPVIVVTAELCLMQPNMRIYDYYQFFSPGFHVSGQAPCLPLSSFDRWMALAAPLRSLSLFLRSLSHFYPGAQLVVCSTLSLAPQVLVAIFV